MPANYEKDANIFEVGEEVSNIYYLIEGALALIYKFETDNRVYELSFSQIKNNTFFGIESYYENKFANYTVNALDNVTVNQTALNSKEDLERIIREKPTYGIQILRSLLKTIAETSNTIAQLDKLFQNLTKLEIIGQAVIGYLSSSFNLKTLNEETLENAIEIFNAFKKNGIDVYPLTQKVFTAPFDKIAEDEMSLINEIDKREVEFFTKLYAMPTEFQNQLYTKEPFFMIYYTDKCSRHFINLLKAIGVSFERTISKYHYMLKPQGLISALLSLKSSLAQNPELTKYLKLVASTILSNMQKLSSFIQTNAPEYFADLSANIEKMKTVAMKDPETSGGTSQDKVEVEESFTVPEEMTDSVEKILQFAELDPEKYKEFKERYNKFKLIKEKLSGDDSIKRFRNAITTLYWDIYYKSFMKYYNSSSIIKPVEMMLRYGLFDEQLVKPKTIVNLYNMKPERPDEDLPIYDLMEWLERIAKQESAPSIDAMGESYEKFIREEANRRSKKIVVSPEDIDTVDMKVDYEIKNLVRESAKICSGEIFNYSPILMEEAFAGESFKYFMPKRKLREEFFKVRSIDFSAFHREVVYREEGLEEFVQKEVLPNIILMPSWGKRSMTWQVKERPKDSRGRILFPYFMLDNLYELVIYVFGCYRWEIVKEILGPLWNDITQMSLTAEYMDYIQFFKKNKDLSMETKEKVAIEFKKYRSDRDKFANDYSKWIEFESEGRPQLNRVARGILYRHAPFPKELRDKLKELPAYSEIYGKFINLRRKEIIRLRNKYQKYTRGGNPLPKALEENVNFYMR